MGLEAATYIADLVVSNPTGADDYATADDHIRLLKSVLQGQFPNFTSGPVTLSNSELNSLDGFTGDVNDLNILSGASPAVTPAEFLYLQNVTSDIQAQLNSKVSGTVNVFAGAGLAGGGPLTGNVTIGVGAGPGIATTIDEVTLDVAHSRNVDHSGVSILAGAGLSGGGTIDGTKTLNVGAGVGISVFTDVVQLDGAHSRNVDHAAVSMIAGNGLTGGGTLEADRTFAITGTNGITVGVDHIQLNLSHAANVDHSTLLLNTAANSGLAGGGDLTVDRSLVLDVNNLIDSNTIPDRNDALPIFNGTLTNKVSMHDFNRCATKDITGLVVASNYTMVQDDRNLILRYTGTGNITISIPTNASVNFEIGCIIGAERYGTGQITWAPVATVTMRSPDNKAAHRVRYSQTVLRKLGTNEWILGGDVGA